MAIKELYNEATKNKVKEHAMYSMPLADFIKEHKTLVKILREGSREKLLAEADEQEKELEKCLKEHGKDGMSEDDKEKDDD